MTHPSVRSDKVRAPVEKPTVRGPPGHVHGGNGRDWDGLSTTNHPFALESPARGYTGNRVLSPLFSSGWGAKPLSDGRGNR